MNCSERGAVFTFLAVIALAMLMAARLVIVGAERLTLSGGPAPGRQRRPHRCASRRRQHTLSPAFTVTVRSCSATGAWSGTVASSGRNGASRRRWPRWSQ